MDIHYHYYNCLYTEQTPWSFCASESLSLQASSNTEHKGLAVNQKTHDPGPVLAERELSLWGEGFWEQALTLRDLRSRLGSTYSCL